MKIGDKVWIFDSNRCIYEDDKGNKLDKCWYKGYFREKYIVGETSQSWIVGSQHNLVNDRTNLKVNKKTLRYSCTNMYGLDGILYISEEQINQECWLHDNKYEIIESVRNCKDYDKLYKIKQILDN